MTELSRRRFLQLLGASALNCALPSWAGNAEQTVYWGRFFTATPLRPAPSAAAPVLHDLLPDRIVALHYRTTTWYAIEGGFVPQAAVQPLLLQKPDQERLPPPFWAEVLAPAVSLRQFCAADAPLVTRIGHGGVLKVVDRLSTSSGDWYGLADAHATWLGWSPATAWKILSLTERATAIQVHLNRRQQMLIVKQGAQELLRTPCSMNQALPNGQYPLLEKVHGGKQGLNGHGQTQHGQPWNLRFGDYWLAGAYWHNAFGASQDGQTIHIPPYLGRWLYQHVSTTNVIQINDV